MISLCAHPLKIIRLLLVLLILAPYASWASDDTKKESEAIPRVIIALYTARDASGGLQYSRVHRLAAMPLNHLGLKLEYYDIDKGLPDVKDRQDVRGILSWYDSGYPNPDPEAYVSWLEGNIKNGKKVVILEDPGFMFDAKGKSVDYKIINRVFNLLGFNVEDEWVNLTYDVEFTYKDPLMVEFERKLEGMHPAFNPINNIRSDTHSHLIALQRFRNETKVSHLVAISPQGGFVADKYAFYFDNYDLGDEEGSHEKQQWIINPFRFFREAFDTDDIIKPDTTTIAGRRLYYSHIDGDGWNNETRIEEYGEESGRDIPPIAAEVIYEKAIKPYPDLPVTVAAIGASLDEKWIGTRESRKAAREIFELPQVEIGSHTYSHPFFWKWFEDYTKAKEEPYLIKYPFGSWKKMSLSEMMLNKLRYYEKDYQKAVQQYGDTYSIPRAFANEPYDLKHEIEGSIKMIESLAPEGKKVQVVMWSGDTSPYEAAIAETRRMGVQNINGGDSRLDREFPSYAWVAPIGKRVGKQLQIYASNSNENTYTDLWTGRFHGFKYLVGTLENTETPMRVKPFNIYYHMYSGERTASLIALLDNLNYAREHEISPVTASEFTHIAEGFFSSELTKLGEQYWRINNRGHLQTFRMDNAIDKVVDFDRSRGVIGQRHYQGSLYIYLDKSLETVDVALKSGQLVDVYPEASVPYLIDSRYQIWQVNWQPTSSELTFKAVGFGEGEMRWKMPQTGLYQVQILGNSIADQNLEVASDDSGLIVFHFQPELYGSVHISVTYLGHNSR